MFWGTARASASSILNPFCMCKEKHNVWQRVTLFLTISIPPTLKCLSLSFRVVDRLCFL